MKYYKDSNNKVYVDPILENHSGLIEITKEEFDAILAPTSEEELAKIEAEAKAATLLALSQITVTTAAGNTFDGDDTARESMLSAIQASGFLGLTDSNWKLADNTWKVIGITELQEAHALAIQAKGAILGT